MRHKEAILLEHSLYEHLYQRYAPALFAYAYRNTASHEDAEDILLDVFLSALQSERFATFDEKQQEAWLWKITRNKTVDYYRRSLRYQPVPIEWLSEALSEDKRLTPEQFSLKREEYAQLANAIQTLPALQQEVLRLRFSHGLKSTEIAPVLDKSEEAVRGILFRAIQHLRRIFQHQNERDAPWKNTKTT